MPQRHNLPPVNQTVLQARNTLSLAQGDLRQARRYHSG
jgi:hypothetical protein